MLRYYSCWDNERLIKVGDDGSWCIKFVDGDVVNQTEEYTPKEVEQMEQRAKADGGIGFMNFRHNGNVVTEWDDRDHALLCPVKEISQEEFEGYGRTWKWSPRAQNNIIALRDRKRWKIS
jgi:hypothetical protein